MSKSRQKKFWFGVMVDMCQTLNLITVALKDHEQRIVLLEGSQLEDEFKELKEKVNRISDPEKRQQGLNALKGLCDLFGIPNLEIIEN